VASAYLRVRPGGGASGSVRRDQPVRVIGRRGGGWRRVVTPEGDRGWVEAGALAPR
jgi:SH3-like domain-containing protein